MKIDIYGIGAQTWVERFEETVTACVRNVSGLMGGRFYHFQELHVAGACSGDDMGASGFGQLHCKGANSASASMYQHPPPSPQQPPETAWQHVRHINQPY